MRDGGSRQAATGEGAGPLGILAGAGSFPLEIAAAVSGRGRAVHVVAIDGFAAPEAARFPGERVGLGQVGRMLRSFRRADCREIVIAGGLQRPDLTRLRPDWGLIRHLPTLLRLTRGGDDSVLRRVVQFLERQGFVVRGAGDVAPELLAEAGPMSRRRPEADHGLAIARAVAAMQALGGFDIGQAVVATAERVIAVESARGTDALLAALGPDGAAAGAGVGGVLVKLAKPGQELRVDLPAIGPQTIVRAAAAGLMGIAVSAGRAIVLERQVLVAEADQAGLFVHGIAPAAEDDAGPALAAVDPFRLKPLTVLARRAPTPSERQDILMARQLMPVLASQSLGAAAIIAGRHVLAVAAGLAVPAMIHLVGRDSQWGRRAFKAQLGTLVIDLGQADGGQPGEGQPAASEVHLTRDVFAAAHAAGLAGVVCLGMAIPESRRAEVIGWANDARMFLLAEEAAHG